MTIDLTADDESDDEPILLETRTTTVANGQPSSPTPKKRSFSDTEDDWATYTPQATPPAPWVCIGMLTPGVLCMYGLPPELQLDSKDQPPPIDPSWSHLEFWGEPGVRPVAIQESTTDASPSKSLSQFLQTTQRPDLAVATLQPNRSNLSASPLILNEFGKLTDKFSKVLAPLLRAQQIQCVSRARLVSKLKARVFSQEIESLIFVRGADVDHVLQVIAQAGLLLEMPTAYRPSDYPMNPPLYLPPQAQTRSSRSHSVADMPSRPLRTLLPAQHERVVEEDSRAQINAVYAALASHDDLSETEPGPLIRTPLFPHQKQALTFLLERERARQWDELLGPDPPAHISLWTVAERRDDTIQRYRHIVTNMTKRTRPTICCGAILADDMGLGKTLTTISLIASTYEDAVAFGQTSLKTDDDDDEPMLVGDSRNRRTAEQARKEELRCRSRATLLVCPLTVISNWETQIREHWTPRRPPRVYVYHGGGRAREPRMLTDYDIVLTTYSTLGNEFANQTTWTAAAGRADTDPTPDSKRLKVEAPNTCQRIEWYRVVLDEAHIVKEARTWQSKAVCNLSSPRRLCLTGTPIQNRMDDLYALLLFLQLDPFHDRAIWSRYCGDHRSLGLKNARTNVQVDPNSLSRVQAIMKFLTLRRMKTDQKPDGTPLLSLPAKTTRIMTLQLNTDERAKYEQLHSQFKEEFSEYVAEGTVGRHYATILHEILILRMMCDHSALVDDSLSGKEIQASLQDVSASIREQGLTRAMAQQLFRIMADSAMTLCAACGWDLAQDQDDAAHIPVVTKCQHTFCSGCFQAHVGPALWPDPLDWHQGTCPCCYESLQLARDAVLLRTSDDGKRSTDKARRPPPALEAPSPFMPANPDTWPTSWSTKIRALIADLLPFSQCNPASDLYDPTAPIMEQVTVAGDDQGATPRVEVRAVSPHVTPRPAPIKSVIFSQWTKMLDKVGQALCTAGIRYRQLDGTMSRGEREMAMSSFHSDARIEVFLVSLRAGGFGLNLVSACRAYLLDPYWNPAVEQQGLDRIYRLGQGRPVIMTKLIVQKSIEEKLLELQRRKLELANRVGRQTDAERQQQRTEDLQLLFS